MQLQHPVWLLGENLQNQKNHAEIWPFVATRRLSFASVPFTYVTPSVQMLTHVILWSQYVIFWKVDHLQCTRNNTFQLPFLFYHLTII